MLYHSTNHTAPKVALDEAISRSEAPDGGLYMPDSVARLPRALFNNISEMSLTEIGYVVANTLFGDDIPSAELKSIVDRSLNFPIPLEHLDGDIYALELFHGPTMTVKDIGARFLARMLRYTRGATRDTTLNIMVATTGHSGSAAANGLHGVEGVNVFVLYPRSVPRQRAVQFTSLGGNVHAIKVDGTIDDCRRIIAAAMSDPELSERLMMTSANSINIGSLLPQVISYFWAYAQLRRLKADGDVWISVPSGNLGILLAGYIARTMGLPVNRLIGACSTAGGFHHYLTTGAFADDALTPSSLTPAINARRPATLPRLMELAGDLSSLRRAIGSGVCSDHDIAAAINSVYARAGYVMDPHTAVAYECLRRQLPEGVTGIVMATAHPASSIDAMTRITGRAIELPLSLTRFMDVNHHEVSMPPTYPAFKKYLLKTASHKN